MPGAPRRTLLVTGGAGFIGSNLVLGLVADGYGRVVTLDKLTYAGNYSNLESLESNEGHRFVEGDIADTALVLRLLREENVSAIFHLAAESHVDRSIDGPSAFVQTNVLGTFSMLEATRAYLADASPATREAFRFVHISTDEVFGSLGATGHFSEGSQYAPNSPYAASKASSDLFVRAYNHTYRLPTITTNCSNNYGPYQFPEKLLPLMILNAVEKKPLPVYGNGQNVRDWLHVKDHCAGLRAAFERGAPGETYLFGGHSERSNLQMVETVCTLVDEHLGRPAGTARELITYVTDRPGHDQRYAVDPSKSERELGWRPSVDLDAGLRSTVAWYLEHSAWCQAIASGKYRRERLGLGS